MARKKRKQVRRSRETWERIVAEYRSSGQSQRRFAESHGLNFASLARWSQLLRREEAGASDSDAVGGLIELVGSQQRERTETQRAEGARLLVGRSVCLELAHLPAPDYVALIARAYEAVSPC